MIIINKSNHLKYKGLKFKCTLGKAGIGKKNQEGDNITPKGSYKIVKVFYRKDRIKNISSKFKLIKIEKNMGWCDDPRSKKYNELVKLPNPFSYEKLYRKDSLYDLILVLNYNIKPTIKNKGSAIFIHVTNDLNKKTKGCVALKKNQLLKILEKINKNTKILIN